ncbi:MAG: SMP-30/gluconolactonase/LRE family protein [Chloroflexi bacterium]|nr:SMP-30/gluconolactonase/LRE family protein [Chloroflexota bacterium]
MTGQIEVFSREFERLLGSTRDLTQVATGMAFCEGTHWVEPGGYLVWSDIPNNRIMRWSEKDGATVFRHPCGNTNGHTTDLEGRILSCETSGRRVSRTEHDGSVVTLVDRYRGGKLTSPNDIVVKSDGSVWFTDPDYGALHPELGHGKGAEQDRNRVYRFEPSNGRLTAVSEDFDKPNGLAFSPDESILYVGDTGRTHGEFRPHRVMAFDVKDDTLSNGRVFADIDPWVPDGMRVDASGNLFVSAGDGIQCFNPSGELIGKIHTPEVAANCSFGMPDRQTLFIAATSSVWSIKLNTAGATRPA